MIDSLKNTTPEIIEQHALDKALAESSTAVAELGFDPDFQAHLVDAGISLDTEDPSEYWGAVADFTGSYLKNHDELSPVEKDSFALIANLPLALTNSYYLKEYMGQMDRGQIRAAKEIVCSYNGLLKHFVTEYPQKSNQLNHSLLNATLEAMGADSTDFTKHAEHEITNTLRGVKHEIGFTRILESRGVAYREATVDEDLKGRDIVIQHNGRDLFGVDVKASLSEVDVKNRGSNGTPIARKSNGDIVMFSMLLEKDFHGGFEPSPQHIKDIAKPVVELIEKVLGRRIAK